MKRQIIKIDEEKCNGCGACLRMCPTGAISGEKKALHVVNPSLCIDCGTCIEACGYGAMRPRSSTRPSSRRITSTGS